MYNNIVAFLFSKNFFIIMIYVADMAILMSDFENFDDVQISLILA